MTTWVTPATYTASTALTAAQLNATRDNLIFLKGALDLLTASTTADTGTSMYLQVTRATTGVRAFAALATGDATARFEVGSGGVLAWSAGSGSLDTNLYRSDVDTLKTDDYFAAYAMSAVGAAGKTALQLTSATADIGMTLGGDVTLYRSAADNLKTDDNFSAYSVTALGSAGKTALALSATTADTGMTIGGDVTLYRSAANVLKSDDQVIAADGITTRAVAGVVSDGSFTVTPTSGTIAVDTTNSRIYVRVGATWKYAALT